MNVLRCLLDIASGLEFLHSMKVLHGDLKVGPAVCLLPEHPALQDFCRIWHARRALSSVVAAQPDLILCVACTVWP